MKRKEYILWLCFVAVLFIAGMLIKGFGGGFLIGFGSSILLFVTTGKLIAEKAIRRIDKGTRDAILHNTDS